MKPYPKYKSSGIEWIGEIPEHWEENKLKYIGYLYSGLTGKKGDDFKQIGNPFNKPFIPFTNIANNFKINPEQLEEVVMNQDDEQNKVEKYDLFFMMSSENFDDVGKATILMEDIGEAYLNSFCRGFRITDEKINPVFINYLLLCDQYRRRMMIEANGFTRINLKVDKVNDFVIEFPPSIEEQTAIANYLDKKTAQIDEFIAKKQKLIELLNEERTAIINETVSGEGKKWERRRLITLGKFFKGRGIKKDETKDAGLPCIRYGEIYTKYDRIVYETVSFIDEETSKNSELIKKGDVLFAGSGETIEDIGKAIIYFGESDAFAGGDVIVLRLQKVLEPTYASYLLNASFVRHQKALAGKGEIIVHIYPKDIREITVPLPSLKEQLQIVNDLNKQTKEIDSTISKIEKEIELMHEYRTALISEVVTGKINISESVN